MKSTSRYILFENLGNLNLVLVDRPASLLWLPLAWKLAQCWIAVRPCMRLLGAASYHDTDSHILRTIMQSSRRRTAQQAQVQYVL